MKQACWAVLTAAAILLGVGGCGRDANTGTVAQPANEFEGAPVKEGRGKGPPGTEAEMKSKGEFGAKAAPPGK